MATFSDQLNPVPYQMPPATGPDGKLTGPSGMAGGGKQLNIRGIANAAKQRGASQIARFKQMMTGTTTAPAGLPAPVQPGGITATAAARTLVDKKDLIDRFTRKAILG